MSSPNVQAYRTSKAKSPFVPRKPEIVTIGRTSVSLYPKVDSSMTDPEKALAYQHNKTALASADLDQRARILTLAERLDLMLMAESGLADWERKLSRNWANFSNLTILSWHDAKGAAIANTTVAGDLSTLLTYQDGPIGNCRAAGIKFVHVQLELDFADLTITTAAGPTPNALLRGEYYIQLPQSSVDLTNGTGGGYRLTTWLGAADLRTLSLAEVKRDILDLTYQDGPYDLLAPTFNLTTCRTDSTIVYGELKSQLVRLASETIHQTLFMVLVPGYSIEPHNVLDHIWQCYVADDGKPVVLTAQVYYTTFLNAIRSFYDLEEYPIDLAGIFQDHINPSLQKGFRSHYPAYGAARSKAAITQRKLLVEMLNALIKAENDVTNIRDIVRTEQMGGEQFHLSPGQAHPSVAEKTLQQYSGDTTPSSEGGRGGFKQECFGCGGPHSWSKMVNGKYVVACPRAGEPGVKEKAELNIQKFQARRKKNARTNKKRRNLNTVNWEDIPEKRREVLLTQRAQLGTPDTSSVSTVSGGTPGGSVIRRSHITLHQDVVVLATQSSKPQIPIAIHSPMPHLSLQTGTATDERDCPSLRCMLDTGASLSTANFHYMEAVVRRYPHILKAIYLPDDYAAIVLSGIVTSSSDAPITTELPVGFEVHLPYSTKDGNGTSLLVAAGPDVAVNLILGLPFIKATGMIVDFIDNVCQAKHLLCDPFPIDFRRATKSIPVLGDRDAAKNGVDFAEVDRVLGTLRGYFARAGGTSTVSQDGPSGPPSIVGGALPKHVTFKTRWEAPPRAHDTTDYQHQVLGDLGYL